jgi:sphinganine C4-monooxygenase
MDTGGGLISYLVSGMTPRTSTFFFTFATMRAVDQHSGLYVPWNPFQWLCGTNSAHHALHHQLSGLNNLSFAFTFWDKLLGTDVSYTVEKRAEGGYEARPVKEKDGCR